MKQRPKVRRAWGHRRAEGMGEGQQTRSGRCRPTASELEPKQPAVSLIQTFQILGRPLIFTPAE